MSGGGSFEAEVANNLRTIQSAVTALTNRYVELERRGTSAASRVAGELRKVGREAEVADKKVLTLQQRIQRMAQAGGKLGGPLGEGAGRILGGLGMGGVGGIAAAGLGGLALIGRVIGNIDRENLERTRKIVELHERRAQIERDAGATRRQQGLTAVQSQGDALRLLRGRGGNLAEEWVGTVTKSGVTSTADAQAGVAQAFTLTKPGQREAVMSAAFLAAMTGEMGFSQAVAGASDPKMLARIMRPNGVEDVVTRMMVQSRGQPMTPANLFRAKNDMHWARHESQDPTSLLGRMATTRSTLNAIDEVGVNRIVSGDAEAGAKAALAEAADPGSAELVKLNAEHNRRLAALERLAAEQLTVVKWFRESWINRYLVGGERSAAGQLRDEHVSFGGD